MVEVVEVATHLPIAEIQVVLVVVQDTLTLQTLALPHPLE
jgi:hypothetical protein